MILKYTASTEVLKVDPYINLRITKLELIG